MNAVLLSRHGKPSVLTIRDVPVSDPKPGQVRVKIKTIGINYAEILSRKGLYGWAPKKPYIPGMESFGYIDASGAGVNRKPGQKVVVGAQYGNYAEYINVDEKKVLPALDFYTAEENAAFPVNYMTAWVCLFELARIRPTDKILINAAAGGVGTAAVQLAKHFGCTVFGTAGNDQKIKVLEKLNIDGAVNYRTTDFEKKIYSMTNKQGVDMVLEVVGGDVYKKSLRLLSPLGRLVVAGFASYNLKKWNPVSVYHTLRDLPRANVLKMAENSYGVMASHLGYLLKHPAIMAKIWQDLVSFVREHKIHPVVGKVYDFEKIAQAHEFMESRQSYGKIVVNI